MYSTYRQLSAWLLVALIIFGQTAVLAHQSGHDVQPIDEYCAQCLTQSVFDGKVAAPADVFPTLPVAGAVLTLAEGAYHSYNSHPAPARDPPASPA